MITRENYEEFFVLYVDNELPATTRSVVEKFVADNPDLEEELSALLQCRVQPDQEPGFRQKELLFHYESSLLSYVDGELDERERSSVEEWARRSPWAGEELRQLQLTVSQPDPSVVFPGKENLYSAWRKRAVILPWLRAGIAAAVLTGAALLLLPAQHRQGPVASLTKNDPRAVTSAAPGTLYPAVKDERKDGGQEVIAPPTRLAAAARQRVTRVKDKPVTTKKDQRTQLKETRVDAALSVKTEVVVAGLQPLNERVASLIVDQPKFTTAVAAATIPKDQSSFATQALLQQEQDNSIAEAPATPAKNKLRGVFRKVGRAFGKTAESDGDGQREVLISAFQVALK